MDTQVAKINTDLYEIHKPSGQISSKLTRDGRLHQLTPVQFDAMNYICYKAREQFHLKHGGIKTIEKIKDNCSAEELFDFLANNWFEIDLNDLSIFVGSYESKKNKSTLANTIKALKYVNVEMGLFKKHDLLVEDVFSLIRRYKKVPRQTKINIMLEPEILVGWVFKTKPFQPLFLKIQTTLSHTYTKVLYENLKDYENQRTISKPLEQWNYILGFSNKSSQLVSTLKRDYLNKSIIEINNRTDIFIESITGTKVDGQLEMVINFQKQPKSRLEELGLIEKPIAVHKCYFKSKTKLDKLVKNGYPLVDEEIWIKTDISRNEDQYMAEQRIDAWLDDTEKDSKKIIYDILGDIIEECTDDPHVFIENYIIKGVFSHTEFTRTPLETIELVNKANAYGYDGSDEVE